jgi:1-aminocyclopropane-1-carboxylate deaminase/D-cysteine desulfhydrase-like pyridoxal-dependent ACC family enzyme
MSTVSLAAPSANKSAVDYRLFAAMRERIARIPRLNIAVRPTPMMEAPNLARHLGGPRIFVKRDDLTGVAFGGNKLRNLEFRLARAMEEKPDTVIVGLDLQSNSARQTVGACNKLGLRTILILEGSRPNPVQGNLLVNYLLGAEVRFARDQAEQRAMMDQAASDICATGGRPYILNDNPMFDVASALAYLDATMEMLEQLRVMGVEADYLYMSSGGKGQAGVALAKKALRGSFTMRGVTASHKHDVPNRTASIANQTAAMLGLNVTVEPLEIENYGNFVDRGYGIPSAAGNEAMLLFGRLEGIILDPIYTGKCAAAMISHIREGRFRSTDSVVFVHTGGAPAIFTWNDTLYSAARPD